MSNIEICNNCNSEIEISEFETERNEQANVAGIIYVESCRHCLRVVAIETQER